MIDTPVSARSGIRRCAQVVLAAALVLHGIMGFPHPGEPDPSSAAAHPLPGWPHSHGGTPICTDWTCPPPDDGTSGGNNGGSNGGSNGGVSRPTSNCLGVHAAGCRQGTDQGYINPNDDLDAPLTDPNHIADMGNTFDENNPDVDFDAQDFADVMDHADHPPDRGDVADALCAAISGCSGSGDEAIQYLLDNDISFGQDTDTVDGFNAERPVTTGQVGSFFYRLPQTQDDPGNNPGNRPGNNPGNNPGDEMCTTGLVLSPGERALFVSQLEWRTLVDIRAQGEPGVVWPPHPDVPGGSDFLVVSQSPVWPVVDPLAAWYVGSDDGCLWEAISVQTGVTQLLPWNTGHRSIIENEATSRPGAGFDTYLSRWDNLTTAQRAQAQQYHRNRDVSASCRIETAMVAADAADRCHWELPSPGVWLWQARACFEGLAEDTSFQECATLASGVEWFLGIIDYTSGITLHDPGTSADAGSWHPAPAG